MAETSQFLESVKFCVDKKEYFVHNMNYEISKEPTKDDPFKYKTPVCTKLEFDVIALSSEDIFFFQKWMIDPKEKEKDCSFVVNMIRDGNPCTYSLFFDKVNCVEITEKFFYPEKEPYNQIRRTISLSGGTFGFGEKPKKEEDNKDNLVKKDKKKEISIKKKEEDKKAGGGE